MSLYTLRDDQVLLNHQHKIIKTYNSPYTSWILILMSLCMVISTLGCGGAKPAREELSKTRQLLESVRKQGCAHDSLTLAEHAYAKSQKLFDEKKFVCNQLKVH